jgi:hypothetical protein
MNLKDGGHGITVESLKFWNENKGSIGRLMHVQVSAEGVLIEDRTENGITYPVEYNLMVTGTKGIILLSGCNCGYGGEGPNGTAKILAELGVPIESARLAMTHQHIHFNVITGLLILDGDQFYEFPLASARRGEIAR